MDRVSVGNIRRTKCQSTMWRHSQRKIQFNITRKN